MTTAPGGTAIFRHQHRSLRGDWRHVEAIVRSTVKSLWQSIESLTTQLTALKEQILELPVGHEYHQSLRIAQAMDTMNTSMKTYQENQYVHEKKNFMMERKIQLIEEELEQIVKRVDAKTQDEKSAQRQQKRSQKCLLNEVKRRWEEMQISVEQLEARIQEKASFFCEKMQASLIAEQNALITRLEETQKISSSKLHDEMLSLETHFESEIYSRIQSVALENENHKRANEEMMSANMEKFKAYVHDEFLQTSVSALLEKRLQSKERKVLSLLRKASNRAAKGEELMKQWGEQMVLYAIKVNKVEQAILKK